MIHSDGDFVAELARDYPQIEAVTGPALKNKERVAQGWIGIAILFKQSKAKEAAVKWIQFLGRDDINERILEECGYVSVKKTVSNKKTAAISPAMAEAMNQTQKFGRPPTPHWLSRDVNGPLIPELQAAFLGEKSPQEALDAAAKAVQKWLDERK
jgi:multiple sugar transport system substrate-binding protein